jgi:hypothetical protein
MLGVRRTEVRLMANRRLTTTELADIFRPILEEVRARLLEASHDDDSLHWALRRKLAKELMYDERGKPTHRVKLKAFKRGEQGGTCALCRRDLPERDSVLDRLEAMKGYTAENTRLLCPRRRARGRLPKGLGYCLPGCRGTRQAVPRPASHRGPEHGPGRRARARRDGGDRPRHPEHVRPLQHRQRG